nr:homeobox-leucine zipper protein HOX23-like [Salvelinus alpinus]
MLKWFSNEEGGPGQGALGSPQGGGGAGGGEGGQAALVEVAEQLAQTEQLVAQLKELIREKDGSLRTKDEQLKAEKEACEAKLSKMRLQNKAKVTSLSAQLEELKKGAAAGGGAGGQGTPTHSKKGGAEGSEQASRGKILLLRKKVEELEHQLSQRDEELEVKVLPTSSPKSNLFPFRMHFEAGKCEGSSKGCKLSIGTVYAFL